MKRIDIEALLTWSYTRELPKGEMRRRGLVPPAAPRLATSTTARIGELGTTIDDGYVQNRYGVVPDFTATDEPHPDAIAVHDAVVGLDQLALDLPADWFPLSDLGDLGADGVDAIVRALDRLTIIGNDGERRLRVSIRRLVEKHAILGGTPEWRADVPERKFVLSANGRPAWFRAGTIRSKVGPIEVEVDGWNERQKRPFADAYRKTFLDPDPVFAAIERAEYELWRAALDIVVDDLAGRLMAHLVEASRRPFRPWEEGQAEPLRLRVLPDLTPPASPAASEVTSKPKRGRPSRVRQVS